VATDAFVVRGGRTKHRPGRKFGKLEFAQATLWESFPDVVAKVEIAGHEQWLGREINARLALNPAFQAKYPGAKVSNMLIARALRLVRASNAVPGSVESEIRQTGRKGRKQSVSSYAHKRQVAKLGRALGVFTICEFADEVEAPSLNDDERADAEQQLLEYERALRRLRRRLKR
jgi:hypothetical protein